MSKGNLFLGFGRGSVGDVVFTRLNGEQVARARNRHPKNPQSPLQLLQRVCLKTATQAYSLFQPITDHSFQGQQGVTYNQARFVRINVERMRLQLVNEINSGSEEDILSSAEANFAPRNAAGVEYRPFVVSEGSLPRVTPVWSGAGSTSGADALLPLNGIGDASRLTYQFVVDHLNLQRGDQLTFLFLSGDDSAAHEASVFNGFRFARVILEPANGDMSTEFISSEGHTVNSPNEKNEGEIYFMYSNDSVKFYNGIFGGSSGHESTLCAVAIIVSRDLGGVWARSNASLVLRPYGAGAAWHLQQDWSTDVLGDAILSFMSSDSSTLYLNQAGF